MRISVHVRASAACCALAASLFAPQGLRAQQPSDSDGSEIVVTAQKREQRLNDVGLTVVAATGLQLQSAGVHDVASLTKIVSGFTSTETPYGTPVFSMRGVNFNSGQLSSQPAVSTYLDEAALPYPIMSQGLLLDVERVEALKGPQGTLFGQNATGGSINIIAAKPTDTLQAGFRTSVNQFGQVAADGYVSGPLSDTLRARLAATTTQFGAWQKCYFGCTRKNGDANKGAARLLVAWTPTERIKIGLNLNANYDHGDKQAGQLSLVRIQVPGAELPGLATYPLPPHNNRAADLDQTIDMRRRNRMYQTVLRADVELNDNITLTSLTNYIDVKQFTRDDDDTTALRIDVTTAEGRIKSFNQEVRVSGSFPDQGLNLLLGANYQRDRIHEGGINTLDAYSGLPPGTDFDVKFLTRYRTMGLFGSADWEISPGLTLTGGARYTSVREGISGCLRDSGSGASAAFFGFLSNVFRGPLGPTNAFVPGGCATLDDRPILIGTPEYLLPYSADLTQKEHSVSWRAGVNYKPSRDSLLYGLVSRGYKAGGFPAVRATNATQIVPVKQEQLTSYEIGVKTALLDRHVQFNAAVFYYDYKNKQFYTLFPSILGVIQTNSNIPKSEEKGVDVDVTITPVEGLSLRGAVTYIDTKIKSNTGAAAGLRGKSFNYAPDWSGTFSADYRIPLSDGFTAVLSGSALYNSATNADLSGSPDYRIAAYTTFDASVGIESDRNWRASLWIRNLTNKYYWTNVTTPADALARFTGLPRTFGATFSVDFK